MIDSKWVKVDIILRFIPIKDIGYNYFLGENFYSIYKAKITWLSLAEAFYQKASTIGFFEN